MSEIRMQEVLLVGRLKGNPIPIGEECFFQIEAEKGQLSFPCFCQGKTAENMNKYLHAGDEISIEGKLVWRRFSGDEKDTLLIYARYISYGRKARTLQPGISGG